MARKRYKPEEIVNKLREVDVAPSVEPIDPETLAAQLHGHISSLEEIRRHGTLEEQKAFLRGFIDRIEVDPRQDRALLYWLKITALPAGTTNRAEMSFPMVAGARLRLQLNNFSILNHSGIAGGPCSSRTLQNHLSEFAENLGIHPVDIPIAALVACEEEVLTVLRHIEDVLGVG
jgi:hypothetical protein